MSTESDADTAQKILEWEHDRKQEQKPKRTRRKRKHTTTQPKHTITR
jgi:hypothetical protein